MWVHRRLGNIYVHVEANEFYYQEAACMHMYGYDRNATPNLHLRTQFVIWTLVTVCLITTKSVTNTKYQMPIQKYPFITKKESVQTYAVEDNSITTRQNEERKEGSSRPRNM